MAKPDCVHCAFMARQQSSEYRCQQHNITLHSPVSVFCKNITPRVNDETYHKWFDETLDTDELIPGMLYTWVVSQLANKQGEDETHVDAVTIANLSTYSAWSAGIFWQMLREIRQKQLDEYRKNGYRVAK